jgi:hypothetical protein
MKRSLLFFIVLFSLLFSYRAQTCSSGQSQIKIQLVPDQFPTEITWDLKDAAGSIVLSGAGDPNYLTTYDSICVPNNTCYTFNIYDAFGDGICCAYGNGSYTIYLNGIQFATGGNYTTSQSVSINCPPPQLCPPGQDQIKIVLLTDNYPNETTWFLKDGAGNTVLSGAGLVAATTTTDSICVSPGSCHQFEIFDSFGDGICCAYGIGAYTIYLNGVQVATGGNFGSSATVDVGCPPGTSCASAIPVTIGNYTAPGADSWYVFTPDSNGMYEVSTCFGQNCNTTIWVYSQCGGLIDNTNAGTIYYDNNSGGCGNMAVITAAWDTSSTYYIRIGGDTSCAGDSILFSINYNGPISGCTDTLACNYNPLAGISDSSCVYYPNPLCGGPDLLIVQSDFESSLAIGNIPSDNCSVQEGCLTGYGTRTIIRFDTHIKNIGTLDYYVGTPTNNPGQFSTTNCHGHPHYEGYAEYVLYSTSGQAVPIGFKNGFCVMDLECSGGGTFQYGCSNMGITAGCGDIYDASLACQWIDITDVDPGSYILAIKVNWDQSPDALGRYENTYTNNWAQVCIDISADVNGNKNFLINQNCSPYVDCLGVPYGSALTDCQGTCNGTAKRGDLNNNLTQETADAQLYVSQILNNTITPTNCNDLNATNTITVWDAALLSNCAVNGTNVNTACVFPHGVSNPYQTVTLKVETLNVTQGYIDVSMLAPNSDVAAYEFTVHGLNILNVASLVNAADYPGAPNYLVGGNKVIGISYIDSSITRSTSYQPLCRIYYSALTDTMICIDQIIDIVNSNYEAVQAQISSPCWTTNGVIGIKEEDASNYFLAWPNPSKGELNISSNFETGSATLTITDVLGKTVLSRPFNTLQKKNVLDVSFLNDGIYTITIRTEKTSQSKRIVLSK